MAIVTTVRFDTDGFATASEKAPESSGVIVVVIGSLAQVMGNALPPAPHRITLTAVVLTEAEFGQLTSRRPAGPVGLGGIRRWIRDRLGDAASTGAVLEITGQRELAVRRRIDSESARAESATSGTTAAAAKAAEPTWLEVTASLVGGRSARFEFIRVPAQRRRIRALRAIGSVAEATAVPALVDASRPVAGGWLVMPYFPGRAALRPADVPDDVFDTLARVHAHYLQRPIAGIPRLDTDWWHRWCLDETVPTIRAGQPDTPASGAAIRLLTELADDTSVARALDRLPYTLVHGDLRLAHIRRTDSGAVILGWRAALAAPPMLDLATIAPPRSGGRAAYARRWRQLSGQPLDSTLTTIGRRFGALYADVRRIAAVSAVGDDIREPVESASHARDALAAVVRVRNS